MRIIGCDLHASQQTIAVLDRETGEVSEHTLTHEGEAVRAFYRGLPDVPSVGRAVEWIVASRHAAR